jgi:outer membrane protein
MTARFFALALAALSVIAVMPAAEAQSRVGYVDPEFLLLQMPEARQIRSELERQAEQDQRALQQLGQQLQQKATEYEQSASLLSDAARQTREQEIVQLQQSLQTQQQQKLQALQQREAQMLQPVFDKFNDAVSAIAEEMNLTFVMASSVNGGAVLLYADNDNAVDLTEPVAARLGISLAGTTGQ